MAKFRLLLTVLVCASSTVMLWAQQPNAGGRDTVVVMRRDTIVIMRRDTVFMRDPASTTRPSTAVGSESEFETTETSAERLRRERVERIQRLREARADLIDTRPNVRGREHAWAYLFYPTRLLEIDFPSLSFGASYVKNGKTGVMANVGILTTPFLVNQNFGTEVGEARFGIRGLDIGLEGRYYLASLRSDFPFYIGFQSSYSLAPIRFERFTRNDQGTYFELREVNASGHRIRGAFLAGWEMRVNGIALDLATGIEVGGRGIFTDDQGLRNEIDNTLWNVNSSNTYNPYANIIMRIGFGIGNW